MSLYVFWKCWECNTRVAGSVYSKILPLETVGHGPQILVVHISMLGLKEMKIMIFPKRK